MLAHQTLPSCTSIITVVNNSCEMAIVKSISNNILYFLVSYLFNFLLVLINS